jgi:uncharacterized protein (TIGR02996 family)
MALPAWTREIESSLDETTRGTQTMLEEAFWWAIQEAPEDDAPRLIYADWLEEQADASQVARAEFIRVQCELARLPEDADGRPGLEKREAALWKKHGKAWSAPLRPFSRKFSVRRGFPDQVLVQGKTFLEHAEQVLSAAPVFSIRLRNAKEQIGDLAQCPALARLIALSLYFNNIGMKRARVFFASPHLVNLNELDLNVNDIQREGLRALTQANLPRLQSLNLRANLLDDAGLEVLAGAPLLGRLHTLGLSHNAVSDAGVAALAASEHAAGLASLDLGDNPALGDAGVQAVAGSPHLARLTHLGLSQYRAVRERSSVLTEAGARALASSRFLAGLTSLDLSGQSLLGDAGARALAESHSLTRLRALTLSGCGITHLGMRSLGAAPFAGELASLDLDDNNLGNEGAEALASAAWPGLRKLSLRYDAIGARGAIALASSPGLAGLVQLDLIGNSLTDAGVKALAQSPHLKRLRTLNVSLGRPGREGFIGDSAREALLARFGKDVLGG